MSHAKVIGITYRNVSRFYIHQCEFIIGEFDELILKLENIHHFFMARVEDFGDAWLSSRPTGPELEARK